MPLTPEQRIKVNAWRRAHRAANLELRAKAAEESRQWRIKNPEKRKAYAAQYSKRYYQANKARLDAANREWVTNNAAKHKAVKHSRYLSCKAFFNQCSRDYHDAHRESDNAKSRENYHATKKANPEKIRLYFQRTRAKAKLDPQRRLKLTIRGRIYQAFRRYLKGCKQKASLDFLGCDMAFLKSHIENQFAPGMSWYNYGVFGWHIDHIKPIDSFDLTQVEQQEKAFHYSNLQPLWWLDNIKKGTTCPVSFA